MTATTIAVSPAFSSSSIEIETVSAQSLDDPAVPCVVPVPVNTSTNLSTSTVPIHNISTSTAGTASPLTGTSPLVTVPVPVQRPSTSAGGRGPRVCGYAGLTDEGIFRDYNEDRWLIVPKLHRHRTVASTLPVPSCSFFAVYDGHGGVGCADFVKQHLHINIVNNPAFPSDIRTAILDGFDKTETDFMRTARVVNSDTGSVRIDKSGSCALVVLIVDTHVFVANLGDSKAILSIDHGQSVCEKSRDHKPEDVDEQKRIESLGGSVFRSKATVAKFCCFGSKEIFIGPCRVMPGKLGVARSFGDLLSKDAEFGGIPGLISAVPDIEQFQLTDKHDFLMLCSDGIYEKLTVAQVHKEVIRTLNQVRENTNIDPWEACVEGVVDRAMRSRSTDNLSAVMISFRTLDKYLPGKR
eukprot:GILK01003281.1.p1 GENE.GILK01003281.1~~GILK01003281.1.p1  ORF type:complete len:410 (-),score=81.21 GILK01003281.1:382-1611(-)